MGYIKGPVGVQGRVKAAVGTEFADSLLDYPSWRLTKDGRERMVEVAGGSVRGSELQVQLSGVNSRDEAALLQGWTIEVLRSDFAEPGDNEFYWVDLIGAEVVNQNGECLGKVTSLMETGAHDVLVVDGSFGQKLIPFVDRYVGTVAGGTITVDWGTDY